MNILKRTVLQFVKSVENAIKKNHFEKIDHIDMSKTLITPMELNV